MGIEFEKFQATAVDFVMEFAVLFWNKMVKI